MTPERWWSFSVSSSLLCKTISSSLWCRTQKIFATAINLKPKWPSVSAQLTSFLTFPPEIIQLKEEQSMTVPDSAGNSFSFYTPSHWRQNVVLNPYKYTWRPRRRLSRQMFIFVPQLLILCLQSGHEINTSDLLLTSMKSATLTVAAGHRVVTRPELYDETAFVPMSFGWSQRRTHCCSPCLLLMFLSPKRRFFHIPPSRVFSLFHLLL